jgi:hypothetical protein
MVYLVVINQMLGLFKLTSLGINTLSINLGFAFLGIIVAYVLGHLMDMMARKWFYLFYKDNLQKRLIDRLRINYPDLKIEFDINDLRILFSFIRHHQLELAETIEKYKVINIMLQNISLGLLLACIYQVLYMLLQGFTLNAITVAVLALFFSMVALKRSALFNDWYWSAIFTQALHYGTNITDMFGRTAKQKARKQAG